MSLRTKETRDSLPTRTWAEIDLDALRGNVAAMHRLAGRDGGEPMAIVKADAYGHGAIPIARACAAADIRYFGVASVEEARALRRAGIAGDIYVLSPILPEEARDAVRLDLIPFVSSQDQYDALSDAAHNGPLPTRCALVIDTGMGREGCLPDDAIAIYRRAAALADSPARIVTLATHFSRADEPGIGDTVTYDQAARFFDTLRAMEAVHPLSEIDDGRGRRGVYVSLANSPGTLRWHPSLVPSGARGFLDRCGLLTYGIEPYPAAFVDMPEIRPILSWRARVTLVRDLPAGATVGYGQTYTLTRPSRIATLAVGYADGLSRKLSSRGVIIVAGRRYKIVGRVSMDQCQIDVTDADAPIAVGDAVTLIGSDGGENLTVLDMAELCETTPHEPTCRLTARVPRIYRGGT